MSRSACGVGRFGARIGVGGLALLFAAGAAAQEARQGEGQGQAQTRKQSFPGIPEVGLKTEPAAPKPAPTATQERVLYETTEELELRAFQSDKAPVFGGRLPAGTLLWKLEGPEYGHVRVALPGGMQGWVSAGFFQADADGWGRTTGQRIAFRYRPKPPKEAEAPVDLLKTDGTRMRILGREGDWYKVLSSDDIGAWVPEGSIREVAKLGAGAKPEDPALAARLETQSQQALAPWEQVREQMAAEAAKAAELKGVEQALADARAAYAAELQKSDPKQQDLGGIKKMTAAIGLDLKRLGATDSALGTQLSAFEQEVDRRIVLNEGIATLAEIDAKEQEKRGDVGATEASMPKVSPRRDFAAVGWLQYRPGMSDYSPFRIAKGGSLLFYLTCKNGRYDLQDFVGREIGVRGEIERPQSADVRVIDIERLVILSGGS